MIPKKDLPADSKRYAELAFREKEKWHRRRARMSLARKLEVLDRLRGIYKERPRIIGRRTRSSVDGQLASNQDSRPAAQP